MNDITSSSVLSPMTGEEALVVPTEFISGWTPFLYNRKTNVTGLC